MTNAVPAVGPTIAPLCDLFENVNRIAVLRGGGIGDLLFALAAVQSLAAAYPSARITLLGTPLHAALLAERPSVVHDVELLPVARGVRDVPGQEEDPEEIERFLSRMRARSFDLAVQVHGGGRNSNRLLLGLGARHTVGTRTPDAPRLERSLTYVYYQHEMLRALEVVGLAGVPPVALEPTFAATPEELRTASAYRKPHADGLVVIHPGATDSRRRWPAESFAEIARRLSEEGIQVLVIGDASDVETANTIVDLGRSGADPGRAALVTSLAGRLSLSGLVGLLASADVVLGNDSGPRHLAQALGVPTVGIYWFGNALNAGPLGRGRQRAHLSWTTRCPVCGRDCTQVGWSAERCEHDESFVADVAIDPVYADVLELRAMSLPRRGR
jgi:ADP-heptose:LPS heptosyltransferase